MKKISLESTPEIGCAFFQKKEKANRHWLVSQVQGIFPCLPARRGTFSH
jgi:hypothetical protein